MNKKVISFSLWGNNLKYTVGALKNAYLAKDLYPGWICRFYIGRSTLNKSKKIIKQLSLLDNVEIIEMNEEGDWTGMFWRFLPASDPDVDIMLSRDCDSRLSKRESLAVGEWITSDKKFHIMRDHPYHTAKIMGGMWGVKDKFLSSMKDDINHYTKGDFWQFDQNFLSQVIYPKIEDNCLVHDEFFSGNNFPSERDSSGSFVGEIFDARENPNDDHRKILINYIGKK